MEGFFKVLMDRLPSWFFVCAAVLTLIGIGGILFWFINAARSYSKAMGKENRLQKLQEEFIFEKEQNKINEGKASQLKSAIINVRPFIFTINHIRSVEYPSIDYKFFELKNLIQRVIDSLASDVKFKPGETHRVGLWIEDHETNKLVLRFASAGFPTSYIDVRELEINHSLAGKSFRRKKTILENDVMKNDEFKPSSDAPTKYKAVVCIPFHHWGVLTIDAFKPMDDEARSIGELYGSILELVFQEYLNTFQSYPGSGESAEELDLSIEFGADVS